MINKYLNYYFALVIQELIVLFKESTTTPLGEQQILLNICPSKSSDY